MQRFKACLSANLKKISTNLNGSYSLRNVSQILGLRSLRARVFETLLFGTLLKASLLISCTLLALSHAHAKDDRTANDHILQFDAFGGYSYIKLDTHRYDDLLPKGNDLRLWGPTFGVAGCVQLDYICLGLSGDSANFGDFKQQRVHIFTRINTPTVLGLNPYFRGALLHTWIDPEDETLSSLSASGYGIEAGFGVDGFIQHWLGIGVGVDLSGTRITRDAVEPKSGVAPELLSPGSTFALRVQLQILRIIIRLP